MPYAEGTGTAKTERPQPRLHQIFEQFQKLNASQSDKISQLEDKLHHILNKREPGPEAKMEQLKDHPIQDAVGSLTEELTTLQSNNSRLSRIYDHLQEII